MSQETRSRVCAEMAGPLSKLCAENKVLSILVVADAEAPSVVGFPYELFLKKGEVDILTLAAWLQAVVDTLMEPDNLSAAGMIEIKNNGGSDT